MYYVVVACMGWVATKTCWVVEVGIDGDGLLAAGAASPSKDGWLGHWCYGAMVMLSLVVFGVCLE